MVRLALREQVGNAEWCSEALQPGKSAGNRFTLLLRHLRTRKERRVQRSVRRVQRHGFINYYGHQVCFVACASSAPSTAMASVAVCVGVFKACLCVGEDGCGRVQRLVSDMRHG